MKKFTTVVLPLLFLLPAMLYGAIYQWTDSEGVTNFTDDPESIPRQYRGQAVRRETDGKVKPPRPASQPPAAATQKPPQEPIFGGNPGTWWREKFSSLRSEIKKLREGLDAKQDQLVQLKRRHAIYMRAHDRDAVNKMQASIDADTAKAAELQRQLEELERAADDAQVPATWRQ